MVTQAKHDEWQMPEHDPSQYVVIDGQHWKEFFDQFSRQQVQMPVVVEVETPEIGSHVLAANAPLVGVTADTDDQGRPTIELIFGSDAEHYFSHTVEQPIRVTVGPENVDPRWIEIESDGGEVLTLRWHDAPDTRGQPVETSGRMRSEIGP